MRKIVVRRGVKSPHFPGLILDSFTFPGIAFDGVTTYSAQSETNKLLVEQGYEFVRHFVDLDGSPAEEWSLK